MPNGSPAVAVSPNNIQYLSFQGGGGKGTAYLGALAWLEKNSSCLPLYKGQGSGSSIVGVSGASAGAITALFVSLGYSSSSILGTLTQIDIGDLVDNPEPGVYCSDPSNLIQSPEIAEAVTNAIVVGSAAVLPVLAEEVPGLGPAIAALPAIIQALTTNALLLQLASDNQYLTCLLMDGGFITGKKLRTFLAAAIANSPYLNRSGSPSIDGTTTTFSQLKQTGAVQLAVIATNLRTSAPMVFSAATTPLFPVADAVAMSASFPFLFKPSLLSQKFRTGCPRENSADYPGLYVDGGLTNNIPIHTFDSKSLVCDPLFGDDPGLGKLPTTMLGLRLSPGDPPPLSSTAALAGYQDPKNTINILSLGNMVLNALEVGANQGQIRTPFEGRQTVVVYSGKLNLLDFVLPSDNSIVSGALHNAWGAMNDYYSVSYANPWPASS